MEVNKDEALRCIEISKRHHSRGDIDKALKFALKSVSLYKTSEGEEWLGIVKRDQPSASKAYDSTKSTSQSSDDLKTEKSSQKTSERSYTIEQVEAVQKIVKCGHNYYDVLGVTKECTDVQIKKSYRKLALQFHPDKNAAPGASDAFKLIGTAFGVLSDPEKRRAYDAYGSQGLRGSGVSSAGNQTFHFQDGPDLGVSPEEIFNMFFGGMGPFDDDDGAGFSIGMTPDGRPILRRRGGFRNRVFQEELNERRRRRREQTFRQNQPNIASWLVTLLHLAPLLLVLFSSLVGSFIGKIFDSSPSYSFSGSPKYSEARHTNHWNVPYFVNPNQFKEYKNNPRKLHNLETEIESLYRNKLQTECQKELRWKQKKLSDARWWGTSDELAEIQAVKLQSCETLQNLKS